MRTSCLSLIALTTCLAAEDVIFQAHLPDGHRSLERTKTGAMGALMQGPAMTAFQRHAMAQAGIDVDATQPWWEIAPIPHHARIVVSMEPGGEPRFAVEGTYADAAQAERAQTLYNESLTELRVSGLLALYDVRRTETTLTFDDGAAVAWPAAPAAGEQDVLGTLHLGTIVRSLGPIGVKVADAFALGDWNGDVTITPTGYAERATLRGRWPAFAPVQMDQLAGVPRNALFGAAIGLDGTAIETWVYAVSETLPDIALGLATADEELTRQGLPSLSDALFTAKGTAWLVVAPSAPFPTVTAAIPASPGVDALVDALAAKASFNSAAAREGAIMLPMPRQAPVAVMLRRSATHWIISTDPMLIDDIADGLGQAFVNDGIAELAERRQPVALTWTDNRVLFQQLAGYLAMAVGQLAQASPQDQETFRLMVPMMNELGRQLPATLGVALYSEEALDIRGTNLSFSVGPMAIAAGITLPAITMVRRKASETATANNMKQIVTANVAYQIDFDGASAPDLATLAKQGVLPDALMRSRLAPAGTPAPHFLYVRPAFETASYQPVLLHDPAWHPQRRLMACLADGSIRLYSVEDSIGIWIEAQALSTDPVAATTGIPTDRWTTIPERR